MTFKRISFLGLPLDVDGDVDTLCRMLREKKTSRLITFIGPDAWRLAQKEPQYAAALEQMSLVLPDGFGVALACRLLTGENCQSFGFDSLPFTKAFFETAVESKLKLGLAGGAPGVDEEVHTKLGLRYPGLNIVQTAHAYGDFTPKIAALKAKTLDVVMVGMNGLREEAFLMALHDAGYKGTAIACGDFFDDFDHYPAVLQSDPCPEWIDRWHLRHLYLFYKKPQKLWRRYLVDYPSFFMLSLKALASGVVEKGKRRR
jgi:N-acetylglucosaminyldiphosphoundecaprenol N-acetyl-beta-D-mannosaminyltransferase